MLKWINLSTIHTCLDCLKEPKLTSNIKPDIIACLGAWYTWDQILQTSLEGLIHKDSNKRIRTGLGGGNLQGPLHKEFLDIGQTEVNRAWWQPPLSLDSWKPVQSWSQRLLDPAALARSRSSSYHNEMPSGLMMSQWTPALVSQRVRDLAALARSSRLLHTSKDTSGCRNSLR
ncbi:hypothetical protein F2Q70_00036788 [Brassica cretica]|uniref:Uncharacterized protein n=1 Tax=Brassica cretica TaxID=69181 RepID=A0A8S9JVL3_BRACR|nr:hypothetical protein F2Q70_00036788 [Brassica cretica]